MWWPHQQAQHVPIKGQTSAEIQYSCQVLCFSWAHLDSASHDSSFCQLLRTDITLWSLYLQSLCVLGWKAPLFGTICNLFTKHCTINNHKWKTSARQWRLIAAVQWSRQWSHFRDPHKLTHPHSLTQLAQATNFSRVEISNTNVVWPHGGKRGNWRSCAHTLTHKHSASISAPSLFPGRRCVIGNGDSKAEVGKGGVKTDEGFLLNHVIGESVHELRATQDLLWLVDSDVLIRSGQGWNEPIGSSYRI